MANKFNGIVVTQLVPNGITVYYYDQLDSTNSDKPNDKSLWTVDNYVEHVEIVRKGLGLEHGNGKQWFLLGQSWGGMLAQEYAIKYGSNASGIVVSNMCSSIDVLKDHINNRLRPQIPKDINDKMLEYESRGEYENPDYTSLMYKYFYNQHVCRIVPWPIPVELCFYPQHNNSEMYVYMQGPSEMVPGGYLEHWSCVDRLPSATGNVLFMTGKYDTMPPDDIKKASELVPNAQYWCGNGSHCSHWDDQHAYFKRLLEFIFQ